MAQSILITEVGSTFSQPNQFTAASPCSINYIMTSTMMDYGSGAQPANAGGIVSAGYINVQFHSNNQWVTGTIYTSQTGAQIKTLVEA